MFWPGEFHGLYCPWGCKESDTTEPLSLLLPLLKKCQWFPVAYNVKKVFSVAFKDLHSLSPNCMIENIDSLGSLNVKSSLLGNWIRFGNILCLHLGTSKVSVKDMAQSTQVYSDCDISTKAIA